MSGPEVAQIVRLNVDGAGKSYFDAYSIELPLIDFAPPALPMHVSKAESAAAYVVIRLPAGWKSDAHPSPRRQILFCLTGAMRMTTSDGDSRMIVAGDMLMMADTAGEGHATEVTSQGPLNAVIVQLPGESHA